MQNISPFLWFDRQAEEAVAYDCSAFELRGEVFVAMGGPGEHARLMSLADAEASERVMQAMLRMDKQDLEALRAAQRG